MGIQTITPKMEMRAMFEAETCVPGGDNDTDVLESEDKYRCPFEGSTYLSDTDGVVYYWNKVNWGGLPEPGNSSVLLANGTICQRWISRGATIAQLPADDQISALSAATYANDYGTVMDIITYVEDPWVADFLLNNEMTPH